VQTFTNTNGCDSVVTLHLTVYQPVTELLELTLCENDLPYHYVNGDIDTTFDVGTPQLSTFNFQLLTQHGCDSTVTLHLTINTANYADFANIACSSYTWNNEVYTESGDYVHTFTNANGCDSVVTLHLTIYQPATETVELTICENDLPYHYVNGDIDTTFEVGTPQLSTFNFQLLTQHGCDSTVTLTLTITPCDTTGITTYTDGILAVYPNPTSGIVTLQLTPATCPLKPEIQIFDIYGKRLQVMSVNGETTQIDLSSYTPGVYLIKLVGDGRVIGVRKVVKE
jgi:hypothetical protein